jgi:hypothetical protein
MLVVSDLFCVFSLQEIMQKKNKTVVVDFSIVQFNSKKRDNVYQLCEGWEFGNCMLSICTKDD